MKTMPNPQVFPLGDGTQGRVEVSGLIFPCALGKGGVRPAADKREGDGATPLGAWPLRRVLYRPDRLPAAPVTGLPVAALSPHDGWGDDPADPLHYNRPVTQPYPFSHEQMWRDDHAYDVVVILGHNDSPPVPGLGSAIFLHVARPPAEGGPGFRPTEGCVALALADLLTVLRDCGPDSHLIIGEA